MIMNGELERKWAWPILKF